jgi:methionyl-tRNA formyltransferase
MINSSKKVSLLIMNEKGFRILDSIINSKGAESIDIVVSSRDNNLTNDFYNEIRDLCLNNKIQFYDRKEGFEEKINGYVFSVGWRWLVHGPLQNKLIVTHDSLLPKYRGFAPLVNYLINGEKEIGVTFLFPSDDYDCGDIILQRAQSINYPIKIKEAILIISELFIDGILEIMNLIEKGDEIPRRIQSNEASSYSLWRNDDDYEIDWAKSAKHIKRFIDAVGEPYRGAISSIEGKKIRILEAEEFKDVSIANRDTGKVIFKYEGLPVIVCGEGLLLLKTVVYQDSGDSALPFKKFRTKLN